MVGLSVIQKNLSRLAALSLMAVSLALPGVSQAASQPRDCDANSDMYCGAYSKSEFLNKIANGDTKNSSANLKQIYYNENRGISQANFDSAQTVDGTVYKDGRVVVGGKTVATNAQSTGREFVTGSTKSGSVWSRPTSAVFASDSIQAWVNMSGNTFHYFILKSCGNTGSATPVATPAPSPKPSPSVTPKPSVSPSPSPSPAPVENFKCVDLMVSQPDKNNKNTYRFTVTSDVKGVDVSGYRFSVHQRNSTTPTNVRDIDATLNYAEYTFGPGTWDINAQVKTSAGITAITEACNATVTVSQPVPAATPASSGQVLGATLPHTGPEVALGGVAGLTAIGYAGRAYVRSRKSLLDALRSNRTTKL
jgi:hypothetical protein